MPISKDIYDGGLVLEGLAQVYTWSGDHDRAIEVTAKAGVDAELHQLCPPQIPSPLETVARRSAFRTDRRLAWAQELAPNLRFGTSLWRRTTKRNPETSSDFGVRHWMLVLLS